MSVDIVGSVLDPPDAIVRMVLGGWAALKYSACVAELDRLAEGAAAQADTVER